MQAAAKPHLIFGVISPGWSSVDDRVRRYLEREAGVALSAFPDTGIAVLASARRTDEPGNRLSAQQIAGSNSVLVTVKPGSVEAVEHALRGLTSYEVFSPLGRGALCRALELVEEPPPELDLHVFRYIANSIDNFCPAQTVHKATPLWKKDIPPAQFELRMSERRQPTAEDFIWAYACISDDPSFQAVELAQFGAKHASIAIAMWKEGPVADLAVETDKSCQRMGYGLTAVSAITKWILEQGEIAVYGAHAGNVPSLRIARRLGFTPLLQEMGL